MEQLTEGERRKNHVHEAQVEHEFRIPLSSSRISEERQRHDHGREGDCISRVELPPARVTRKKCARGKVTRHLAYYPEHCEQQRHYSEAERRCLEQIVR